MSIVSLSLDMSSNITGPLGKVRLYASNITGVSYNYNSLVETKKRNAVQK